MLLEARNDSIVYSLAMDLILCTRKHLTKLAGTGIEMRKKGVLVVNGAAKPLAVVYFWKGFNMAFPES